MSKPVLWIIRGLPGSGKSTFALKLAKLFGYYHCEADQYFVGADGSYNFDPNKLGHAHEWCIKEIHDKLKIGQSIIVSNTFTKITEIESYLFWGLEYDINIIEMVTQNYGSVHNVPESSLQKMRNRWIPNDKLNLNWTGGTIRYVTL